MNRSDLARGPSIDVSMTADSNSAPTLKAATKKKSRHRVADNKATASTPKVLSTA